MGDTMNGETVVDVEFRLILDLLMCADPSPLPDEDDKRLRALLNERARRLGFDDWVDAYHRLGDATVSRVDVCASCGQVVSVCWASDDRS